LTAYEMAEEGINCTLITDNTAGYIMYNKMLDAVIVGADRDYPFADMWPTRLAPTPWPSWPKSTTSLLCGSTFVHL
jgi:hypothetical protein